MKAHTATRPQHTATPATCPDCGRPGPHHALADGWVECGNHYRTRIDEHRWTVCGATWRLPVKFAPEDTLTERVITILDETDIAVVDASDGETLLTWECTVDLARAIAADPVLADLIRRQELGGAA